MIYEKLNTNESKELALKDVKKSKNWKMKPINAIIDFESLSKSIKKLDKNDIQIETQLNSEIIIC